MATKTRTTMAEVTSVTLANAFIKLCATQSVPLTYLQLELLVNLTNDFHKQATAVRAYADEDYPAIVWKFSTVKKTARVKRLIPLADNSCTTAIPEIGSSLDVAMRKAYNHVFIQGKGRQ